jgi:hypothetical protein
MFRVPDFELNILAPAVFPADDLKLETRNSKPLVARLFESRYACGFCRAPGRRQERFASENKD